MYRYILYYIMIILCYKCYVEIPVTLIVTAYVAAADVPLGSRQTGMFNMRSLRPNRKRRSNTSEFESKRILNVEGELC